MFADLYRQKHFKTVDHSIILWEGQREIRRHHLQDAQTDMEDSMVAAPAFDSRRLTHRTNTGAWLTMLLSTVNDADLGRRSVVTPSL